MPGNSGLTRLTPSPLLPAAGSTRKGQDKFKALSEVLFGGAADSLIDDTPSQPSVSKRKAAPSDGNGYASEQTTSFKGDQAAPSEEPAGPRAPKRAKPDLELVPVEVALMTDLLGDADDAGDGAEPEDDIETVSARDCVRACIARLRAPGEALRDRWSSSGRWLRCI